MNKSEIDALWQLHNLCPAIARAVEARSRDLKSRNLIVVIADMLGLNPWEER